MNILEEALAEATERIIRSSEAKSARIVLLKAQNAAKDEEIGRQRRKIEDLRSALYDCQRDLAVALEAIREMQETDLCRLCRQAKWES